MNIKEGFKQLKFWKKLLVCASIVIGVFVLLILSSYGYQKYNNWKFDQELKKMTEEINKPYLEDTYGGKTPKETLEMFIAAVEKEDFDLASKYFVISKQEEWRIGLNKIKEKNNLEWIIKNLKKESNLLEYIDPTPQLKGSEQYTIGKEMMITFIKYPRGIWKIQSM